MSEEYSHGASHSIRESEHDERGARLIEMKLIGAVTEIAFNRGSTCGFTFNGVGIHGTPQSHGVLSKTQMIALRDFLNIAIDEVFEVETLDQHREEFSRRHGWDR